MTARCLACGEPILVTLTVGHKRMPLNAEPSPSGTIDVRGGYAIPLSGAELDRARFVGRRLYTPHRPDCNDFARWRNRP